MKLTLQIDPEEVTIDDLVMVDEMMGGSIPARQLKSFVSRFIVSPEGKTLPDEERQKIAGSMTMKELKEAFTALGSKMKQLQAEAVNPTTGGG